MSQVRQSPTWALVNAAASTSLTLVSRVVSVGSGSGASTGPCHQAVEAHGRQKAETPYFIEGVNNFSLINVGKHFARHGPGIIIIQIAIGAPVSQQAPINPFPEIVKRGKIFIIAEVDARFPSTTKTVIFQHIANATHKGPAYIVPIVKLNGANTACIRLKPVDYYVIADTAHQ